MKFELEQVTNQRLLSPKSGVEVFLKREDLIHPFVSGNKYRKLKYNLQQARLLKKETLLTFGGAYSNHIAALAAAGNLAGFKTIGVIRGAELETKIADNATLLFAQDQGMQFKFVERSSYRQKHTTAFINALMQEFGDFYLVPEGGTNAFGVKGCEEILTQADNGFDYICCAVGTGGTISGLINASNAPQKILGFPALKGHFLKAEICKFAHQSNWQLITDYHFGGYAKINDELIQFINEFKCRQNIQLDPVYTGKMMYGLFDLINKSWFPDGAKILAIHTGGLQGINGMNSVLNKKNKGLIVE